MNNNTETVENKVEDKLNEMSQEKKDNILSSFNEFKSYLGDKLTKGEKLGLNDNQLALAAKETADYLATHEEPQNEEQYLLHELWKVGNEEEQHHLAHMLVKLVKE
ncbi:hypothetical protein COJ36_05780 [Priestia megaterium]|uniref:DUF3243 domain-containing protein n=1 Tax=Priestia megaterium TaxID=1404 RepID=UPI000BF5782E|nr:DUF3243 domain-containing protein [Priestia megaterium]PFL71062.1 hypothetical protein COJ36_05780 [Priestia megaterium]